MKKRKGKGNIRVGMLRHIKEGKSYQQMKEEAQDRLKLATHYGTGKFNSVNSNKYSLLAST